MTTALTLAMLLLIALPSGRSPAPVRRLGDHVWVAHVASWTETASHTQQVPVALLAALLAAESHLDPNARSRKNCRGLGQLNPRTPTGREWLQACRLVKDADQCAELNVHLAARELRRHLDACGDVRDCAVARYRGARAVRHIDRDVVRNAQMVAYRMRLGRLVAWEGGAL